MELSIIQVADWCARFVHTLVELMKNFVTPMRDWMFKTWWIPEHSLIGKIWYGLTDTIFGPFFDFSLLEVILGAGLLMYLIYQLMIWILNLIT